MINLYQFTNNPLRLCYQYGVVTGKHSVECSNGQLCVNTIKTFQTFLITGQIINYNVIW